MGLRIFQHGIQCSEQHPCHTGGGEAVGVARQLGEEGERCQEQRHSRRVQQQEILVGQQTVDHSGGSGVVDPVVVVADAEEPTAAKHRNQPDQKGDHRYSDRP
jgi:hypothetical protein